MSARALAPQVEPAALLQRGLRLEYATLAWNAVGTLVLVVAAVGAMSVALAAFALDSLVEILASTVVVWHLRDVAAQRERTALLILAAAFAALAVYVTAQATAALVGHHEPSRSLLGIGWTAATFVAMVALASGKGRTGAALGNRVLMTESRVTLIDAYLAAAVLLGLVLNAVVGVWWADPAAGLVVVLYALRESRAALAQARGLQR
jgi:divalent metal cation (Fe/Co/Zn/Cd) transporter